MVGTNFTKIENYFIFEMLKKKFGPVKNPYEDICDAGSGLSEEEKQAYQAEIKSLKERMLASKFQCQVTIVEKNGKNYQK